MATSGSASREPDCVATASVFSGRPDPTWRVATGVVRRLRQIWDSLPPYVGERPSPPPVGYRGFTLRCSEALEWTAYGSVVTLGSGVSSESRSDTERAFEKALAASAPPGTLPKALLGHLRASRERHWQGHSRQVSHGRCRPPG
jgi:hypothetical protein